MGKKAEERRDAEEPRGMPRWTKALLVGVGALLIVGLILQGVLALQGGEETAVTTGAPDGPAGTAFVPPGTGTGTSTGGEGEGGALEPDGALDGWSLFFVKGGFGFFVGFSLGYVLRTFLKLSALVAGLILLALFGLSYAGVLEVNWETMEGYYDSVVARIGDEMGQFRTFIAGSLPSAGMLGLGLFAGFKVR